jgi:hypothetical protein
MGTDIMKVKRQSYRQQRQVSRSAGVLFTLLLFLLPLDCANAAISVIQGSLTQFVADFKVVTEKSEAYVPPTDAEKIKFRTALTFLLKRRVSRAQRDLSRINMELVNFNDTTTGITFYLIREKSRVAPRGWGLYAINLNGTRSIVIETPHPIADAGTESEGASFFLGLSARALLIAGTHRCANTQASPCSGTTSVCSDASVQEPYRISDAAHSKEQLFHVAHKVLLNANAALVAIALHGYAQRGADPYAFVSDATKNVAPAANVANQFAQFLRATTGLANAAQSCNDGSTGARLCGTEDIQGRYANGSPDACLLDAPATGRFLHIEQSLDFRTVGGAVEAAQMLSVLSQLF